MIRLAPYAKAVAAAVGSLLTVLSATFADDLLGFDEVGTLVTAALVAVATVVSVFRTENVDIDA